MRLLDWIGRLVPALSLWEAVEDAVENDATRAPIGTGDWDVIVSSKNAPRNRTILRGVTEERAKAEVKRWWDRWGGGEFNYLDDDHSCARFYRRGGYKGVVAIWGPDDQKVRDAYLKSLDGKPEPPACGFDIW